MSPDAGLVLRERGAVWRLTLNRPEARNAVSFSMLAELTTALDDAAGDAACRVVLIRGAGKDFCAGADVADLLEAREGGDLAEYGRAFESVLGAIERLSAPAVAAVHGSALGAGCQIAAACDLVVTTADARFGIPSARLGIVINYENVGRLVASIGPKRAGEMLMAARTITGIEAVEWGLANVWVEPEALDAAAGELAERVAALAPLSVSASKRGIRAVVGSRAGDREGRGGFEDAAAMAWASRDLLEGIRAFRERRSPEFEGA
jgi:enoyl-CoA hydratase